MAVEGAADDRTLRLRGYPLPLIGSSEAEWPIVPLACGVAVAWARFKPAQIGCSSQILKIPDKGQGKKVPNHTDYVLQVLQK